MTKMAKTKTQSNEADKLPLEARAIQCIASLEAPKTTQDSVDQLAAELSVASLLRTYAEKRYEAVKRRVVTDYEAAISELRENAAATMTKTATTIMGEDYCISLNANRPAMRVDTDELRTELVRLGIKVDLIDKAIKRVTKKATPALIMNAAPLVVE